jgi:hypothetical protein
MKRLSKPKALFGILLIIGLILIISLLFANQDMTRQNSQAPGDTSNPATVSSLVRQPTFTAATLTYYTLTAAARTPLGTLTPATPLPPTTTSTLVPHQCTFPLAETTQAESTPEEYIFSEPLVVLTEPYMQIAEWLPNNQQVLITKEHMSEHYQSIELFNPQTGGSQVYATRTTTFENPPLWISGVGGVIYPVTSLVNLNLNTPGALLPPYHLREQLWISQGDPAKAITLEDKQMTLDYSTVFTVAVKPDGNEIAYLDNTNDKQVSWLRALNFSLEPLQSITLDITQLDYQREKPLLPAFFNMLWRPNSSQIFLYSDENHGKYTFILDMNSGKVCEVNLIGGNTDTSGSVAIAHWSPDGRYLAVIRYYGLQNPTDLAVLDMKTGRLYEINAKQIIPLDEQALYVLVDIAWAPDNRHLAVIGQVVQINSSGGNDSRGLYIIDFVSNQSAPIAPDQRLGSYFGETNIIWSRDGSKLLAQCPTFSEGRLCLLSVQRSSQP